MNRLKELRKGKNLTQDDLAELLEVTKLTISNWESGKHEIKADKIKTLCKTFGVDAPYLLGYSEFKNEADIKAAALDETLKKLHVIKDNMILRESDEGPNLLDLGLGTAIAAIESFKKEIELEGGQ